MADLKFSCPHCNQHITCDELWGGQELQCPNCQGTLTVPAAPAPASAAPPPRPAGGGNSLVPQPPAAAAPRLSIGQAHAPAAAAAAQAPQRTIPIRNLAPPAPKKSSPVLKYIGITVAVLALAAGAVYGFMWLHQVQTKANEKSRAEGASSSMATEAGHIANLNKVLDATEPGAQTVGGMTELRGRHAAGAPTYTLDLASANIPQSTASGRISGAPFVTETARIDMVGSAHVLQLLQGQVFSPDREVLVYLHLQPGEALAGKTLNISPDMTGSGVPQVSKRWKVSPQAAAPTLKAYSSGYAMKLELGAVANGSIAGKIFLALPDTEKTVVAGTFNATISAPPAVQATPTAAPAVPTRRPYDPSTARYGR